uniref:Peptidase S1 domain-containing protein n=1 Tax=Glossina morsitans morsitans TaxID=37546 RepID=A0A1B0G0U6_GLOMM
MSSKNRNEIHVGFIIVGSYRYPNRIPYSQADKFMDGKQYMKSSHADMPHLGLIKIQATLRLHPYYVLPMKLPEQEYNGSENCVIVGWGNFRDKFTFTHTVAFETKVQVMDVEACRTATDLPSLHDNCICILSELGDEICEAAGGEPIICDDVNRGTLKSFAEPHQTLLDAYDDPAPSYSNCRFWFQQSKSGDFDDNDKERSGEPKKFEGNELQDLLGENPAHTPKELSNNLADESTFSGRLYTIAKI